MFDREPNSWKGFILGPLGGVAGVVTTRCYWQAVSALAVGDPRSGSGNLEPEALHSISLIGKHHEEGSR